MFRTVRWGVPNASHSVVVNIYSLVIWRLLLFMSLFIPADIIVYVVLCVRNSLTQTSLKKSVKTPTFHLTYSNRICHILMPLNNCLILNNNLDQCLTFNAVKLQQLVKIYQIVVNHSTKCPYLQIWWIQIEKSCNLVVHFIALYPVIQAWET